MTDQRPTFAQHINNILSILYRAHARAGLIHKCFLSSNRATLVRAFTTYVPHTRIRPHHESRAQSRIHTALFHTEVAQSLHS